jgi:hypothetical protein
MAGCDAPIPNETLLEYWAGDGTAGETEAVEAHLFECAECTARLAQMASMSAGVVALVRQGRLSGLISRTLLNRLQRAGLRLRLYSVSPGETVPCAVFPGDDVVVTSLRADFAAVDAVTLSVTGLADSVTQFENIPIVPSERELFWAFPGAFVRQLPSTRVRLTLTSAGPDRAVLGTYVLEHSAVEPASG